MLGVIAGAGVAAAAFTSYASMAPHSEIFGKTFSRSSNRRQLALTFDDGPNDPHTLRLLDVLARHNVKATFFFIGSFVKQRPDIARSLAEAGHTIWTLTYSH